MQTAKNIASDIVQNQPEDSSFEEIIKEIAFARMVEKGLGDSDTGRIVTNSEVQKQIHEWQK